MSRKLTDGELFKQFQEALNSGKIEVYFYSKFTYVDSQSSIDKDTFIQNDNEELILHFPKGQRVLIGLKE